MTLDRTTRRARKAGLRPHRDRGRRHHPDFDRLATQGWKAMEAEGRLSEQGWRK
jgi:agmatinase